MTTKIIAQGIDCSTPLSDKTAAALAGLHVKYVARYLVPPAFAWKRLSNAEAKRITSAGMRILSVYETSANRAAGGAAAGKPDGIYALTEAKAVGQPEGTAIYAAVDFDAGAQHFDAIERYLRAFAKEIPGYEVGVYGSYDVVEAMAERGVCKHFWQTYAWSGGKRSEHANFFQYKNGVSLAGITLDMNECYGGEGSWMIMPEKPAVTLDKEAAQKVINDLGSLYMASADKEVMKAAHYAADALRKAAGLPVQ